MKCQEVVELMHRCLDHDLNEMDEQHLTRHLLECSDCAALFERLKRVSSELESLPKVMPSFSLVDAIMPQLEQYDRDGSLPARKHAASRRGRTERIRNLIQRWPYKAIGGVVAAGIVIGIFITTYQPQTVQDAGEHYERQMSNEAASSMDQSMAEDQSIAMDNSADAEFQAKSGAEEMNQTPPEAADHEAPSVSPKSPSKGKPESEPNRTRNDQKVNSPRSAALPPSKPDDSAADRLEEPAEPSVPGDTSPSEVPIDPEPENDGTANIMVVPEESEEAEGPTEPPVEANGADKDGNIADELIYESPDGTMSATVEREQLLIYTSDEPRKLIFESAVLRGAIVYVEWSSDSKQVTYETSNEGTITRYKVDVELRQEWMEAMMPEDAAKDSAVSDPAK